MWLASLQGFAKSTGGILIIAACSQGTVSLQKIRDGKLPPLTDQAKPVLQGWRLAAEAG